MVVDQRVVLHVPSRTLHVLRADASAIWPFLDGSVTLDELARELGDDVPASVEKARATVAGWVDPLLEAGLLEVVTEPPG